MKEKDVESSESMIKILNRNKKLLRIINLLSFSFPWSDLVEWQQKSLKLEFT